jgi:PKD domain/Secretion system C-terminal sorting domain/CARDB
MKKITLSIVIIFFAGLFNYIYAQNQKAIDALEGQINPSTGEHPNKTSGVVNTINIKAINSCSSLNYLANKTQNIAGIYTDLGLNGTVISTGANFDDTNSAPQNIGFAFEYNCESFTQFILNTNGFIKLGNTPPSGDAMFFNVADGSIGGVFNSTDPDDVNLIVPFNHDLTSGTGTPEYRVYTEGTAPDRVCTIQFKNVRDKTTSPAQQYDNMQFQIKLYETSNDIEFVYGDWTPSANLSAYKSAACGLKGSGNEDKDLLVVGKGSVQEWSIAYFQNSNYYNEDYGFNFGNPPDRPKPDAGRTFRFTPICNNDLTVGEIYSMGEASSYFSNPQTVSVNIINTGFNNMTDIPVTLTVSGANSFTDTKNISLLNSGENINVTFNTFSTTGNGTTNITVTLPDDDYNEDNTNVWIQNTNNFNINYSSTENPDNTWGYSAGYGGIFYAKYHVNGTTNIASVNAFISNWPSDTGKTVFGIVLNQNGIIVSQSSDYVILETDLNSWHTFTFDSLPTIANSDFYAGFGVRPGTEAYYAMGVQAENPNRGETYYYSGINGSGLTGYNPTDFLYRFMLGATFSPRQPVAGTAYSNSPICSGSSANLTLENSLGSIQWQQSTDGVTNWTDVSTGTGATTAHYTTGILTSSIYYRSKVSEPTQTDVFSNIVNVIVNPSPTADFSYLINQLSVNFTNSSLNATSFDWDFGDNTTHVNTANPIHTFTANGTYTVQLTAYNGTCSNVNTQSVVINATAIENIPDNNLSLLPNPVSDVLTIGGTVNILNIKIYDYCGKLILNQKPVTNQIDVSNLTNGIYTIIMFEKNGRTIRKFVKQ